MSIINTKKNIESWHSNLKIDYLGKDWTNRPDALAYNFIGEILPDLWSNVLRLAASLGGGRIATTDNSQLDKCMKIAMEFSFEYVHILTATYGSGQSEQIVKEWSFQDENRF